MLLLCLLLLGSPVHPLLQAILGSRDERLPLRDDEVRPVVPRIRQQNFLGILAVAARPSLALLRLLGLTCGTARGLAFVSTSGPAVGLAFALGAASVLVRIVLSGLAKAPCLSIEEAPSLRELCLLLGALLRPLLCLYRRLMGPSLAAISLQFRPPLIIQSRWVSNRLSAWDLEHVVRVPRRPCDLAVEIDEAEVVCTAR
mmetsp:Transcript_127459/g.271771  ORF Transcript_127459/g.271771 Transcript_127459/m.271771 type:complete len:200 (+) Transcript_127459:79-678(+)